MTFQSGPNVDCALNFGALYRRDFTDCEYAAFRSLQATTGTLISGSTMLEFFGTNTFSVADLDLFVQHTFGKEVGLWLISIGYLYRPRQAQHKDFNTAYAHPDYDCDYGGQGIGDVYNFSRSGSRNVQLVTGLYSAFELILSFHSTLVMNFATHRTAYSLFPFATFVQRRALSRPLSTAAERDAKAKYEGRGWRFEDPGDEYAVQSAPDLADCSRKVGDARCWVVKLPHQEGLRFDDVVSNTWYHGRTWSNELEMTYGRYSSKLLRYKYVRY
ncbi:hypothetical protein Hypma_009996 [Hypsizygus marmoreus]|uniref:Uncharacterized protein n=1 Tax=Hypsizygus marmoreus TaxID=39966 RepID=A0A369JPQ8_HYPMA|nr:hypothetical protein Hypma_009996 [Hypsizygus marmoreus]